MSAYNFPKPFSTSLKIQAFFLGSWPLGAGGLYFAIFMHGALTALTAFTMIIILTGGL
jgi:hypothetical protein